MNPRQDQESGNAIGKVMATKAKAEMNVGDKTIMHLESHQVILRPLVTEKGIHRSERYNQYAFEVNMLANKLDVRRAVEELFDVKVVQVRTQNRKGKSRRHRFRYGMTKSWKRAIVKLGKDSRIDFY